ncbi:MAG: 4'-phosphopantetheinyl transferase family protein [Spongiibacter marinus]|uniref:4'-phosphopantetheinyl transferase family protein n=1 Tax=Spongiibacter marinus TaxID=354246 RepID=UPI003C410566
MNKASEQRRLSAGQVDVWCCATDDPRLLAKMDRYLNMLSDEEKQEYEQRQHAGQAEEYLASRAFLRTVLAQYTGQEPEQLTFDSNDFGKPFLPAHSDSVSFNAAHTHGLTLCAVTSGCDIGVDVEFQTDSQGMLDAADDYLSPAEMLALREVEEEGRLSVFFRSWTLKEAYLKARGKGLSIPLHDFSVLLNGLDVSRFDADDAERWELRLLAQDEDFTAAIAVAGKIAEIKAFHCLPLVEMSELGQLAELLPAAKS